MKTYTTKTAKNGATLYYSVETGKRIAKETALENERKEIVANGTVAERYELAKEFYDVTRFGGIETIGNCRISVPHGKSINHIVGGYTTKSRVQWHTISNYAAKIDLKHKYNLTIDEFRAAALADKGFTAEQISQLLALRDDNETRLALTFSKMCEAFEAENKTVNTAETVTDEAETVNLDGTTEIGDDTEKHINEKFKTANFNEAQKVAARIEEIIAAEIVKASDGYDETAFDLLPTVDELNDVEIEADSDETTATVEAETPAVIDFSDEADMFTPDLEPELTQSRLVPDNNVTVEEPDFSDWDAELEAEMKAEFAEVEASLQDLQTSLEIEISEGNLDNAQIIAEKIVELNARYGYLYEQIYGHTVEIFTDPAQVIADAIEITAIVDEEQRKVFDETVAEIKTPAAELKAKYDASDDEDERVEICVEAYRNYIEPRIKKQTREIAAAVADTMNADAPAGWKITPTKSGNFQILHGDNVEFVDTITAGDYLNPKEFFDQFRQSRAEEDDEREAALRQEERERDQLIAMRDELVANFPDDIKRLRTLNEMIEEHEDNIAMLESLLRRPPDKVVDFDKQGNITQVWF